MFKRIKRAWKLANDDYIAIPKQALEEVELKSLAQAGVVQTIDEDSNKGGFLGSPMTEEEIAQHIKENELGWKKIFDKIRNLQ